MSGGPAGAGTSWRELLAGADEAAAPPAEVRLLARLLLDSDATRQHIRQALAPGQQAGQQEAGCDLLSLAAALEPAQKSAALVAGRSQVSAEQQAAVARMPCLEMLRGGPAAGAPLAKRDGAGQGAPGPLAALCRADPGDVCDAIELLCPAPGLLAHTRRLQALHRRRAAEPDAGGAEPPRGVSAVAAERLTGEAWRCAEACLEGAPLLRRCALLQRLQGAAAAHAAPDIAASIEAAVLELEEGLAPPGSASGALQALDRSFSRDGQAAALRRAELAGQPREEVVLRAARQAAADWRAALGGTAGAAALWPALDALFAAHRLPPWTAAQFFVREAEARAAGGGGLDAQAGRVLQLARAWLGGSRAPVAGGCPAPLLDALALAGHLCGEPERPPQGQAWVPAALADGPHKGSAGRPRPGRQAAPGSSPQQLWQLLEAAVRGLLARAPAAAVQAGVRRLLEAGDVAAARALSELLPSPPIELALTEAAVRAFRSRWQAAPGEAEGEVAALVPAAVLAFMTRRGARVTCATELLAALCRNCRPGAGHAVCRWVEVAWQAAAALGLPCGEVVALGPLSVAEALLLRGAPLRLVRELCQAGRLSEAAVGRTVAHLYLKGLMLQPGGGSRAGGITAEALTGAVQGLAPPLTVATALLEQLLDSHGALDPHAVAEVMLTAHRLYADAGSFAGADGLLDLAPPLARAWAARGEAGALRSLAAGLGQYRPVQHAVAARAQAHSLSLGPDPRRSRSEAAARLLGARRSPDAARVGPLWALDSMLSGSATRGGALAGGSSLLGTAGSEGPGAAAVAADEAQAAPAASRLARFKSMLRTAAAFQEAGQPRRAAAIARLVVQLHDG